MCAALWRPGYAAFNQSPKKNEGPVNMDQVLFQKAFYYAVRAAVRPYLWLKYQFTTDYVPEIGEPYILLSNHTTEEDMLFTGIASRRHLVFVCGEHLLRNKRYGKLIRVLVNPIPLPKGGSSLEAVRKIIKRSAAGENICMFPEGKRSFHGETIPSPVSLGRKSKAK